MRRLPAWLLIALAGTALPIVEGSSGRDAATHAMRGGLDLLAVLRVAPAAAQEVLEFKPVPAESASALERSRPARRLRSALPPAPAAPAAPGAPAPSAPSAPIEPIAPSTPRAPITIGKSGNIMRVGSDIHIEPDQVVVGDVMAVGGDVTVDGHVEGDVVAMGGDVYMHAAGRVDGDVVCMGGELHEDEGAVIGGQRVTASRHGRYGRTHRVLDPDRRDSHGLGGHIVWLIITLGIAWAFAGLAPGRTGRSMEVLKSEPGTAAVTGILAAMLTVPSIVALCLLVALLCITIIGIPLAIAALFGYFAFLGVLWVWGYVIGAAVVGERLTGRFRGAGAAAAPGTVPPPYGAPGVPIEAAPAAAGAGAGLTRAALSGVLLIGGCGILGSIFQQAGVPAIGTLLKVFSWLAFSALTLIGAGAWLRAEFKAGTLSRLWGARRKAQAAPAVATAAPAPGPAGVISTPPGGPPETPAGA